MRDAAEAMVFEHRQKKLEILNNSRRWKGLVCKSCKHTCTDQAATHCPTCGVRLDSRVTIALRSGEPSPFASKPPSGKATPAGGSRPGTADRKKKALLESDSSSVSSSFVGDSLSGIVSNDLESLASKSHAEESKGADSALDEDAPSWMKLEEKEAEDEDLGESDDDLAEGSLTTGEAASRLSASRASSSKRSSSRAAASSSAASRSSARSSAESSSGVSGDGSEGT